MTLLLATETPTAVFPKSAAIDTIVEFALAEDIGRGDITTEATVPADRQATAEILQKAPGVLCGLPLVEAVFAHLDPHVTVRRLAEEGSYGDSRVVASIEGPAQAILSGERTGLDDGFLIKENHIRAAGGITAAVHAAQNRTAPGQVVEVEVTNLDELEEALQAGATLILLDNFGTAGLREAVTANNRRARLEASGGITLANLRDVAETGVDFISLGALTHSAGVLDFSLDLEVTP